MRGVLKEFGEKRPGFFGPFWTTYSKGSNIPYGIMEVFQRNKFRVSSFDYDCDCVPNSILVNFQLFSPTWRILFNDCFVNFSG